MSLNERRKEIKFAGKGHNEILKIANPLENMTAAKKCRYDPRA
jgi:hypothetical protein